MIVKYSHLLLKPLFCRSSCLDRQKLENQLLAKICACARSLIAPKLRVTKEWMLVWMASPLTEIEKRRFALFSRKAKTPSTMWRPLLDANPSKLSQWPSMHHQRNWLGLMLSGSSLTKRLVISVWLDCNVKRFVDARCMFQWKGRLWKGLQLTSTVHHLFP